MSAIGDKQIVPDQGRVVLPSRDELLTCLTEQGVTANPGGALVIPPFSKSRNSGVEGGW